MKLKTLFESKDGSLIGKYIVGRLVEPDMKIWDGNFYGDARNFTSLKGCPEEIKGNFNCSFNTNLTSLELGPKIVDGDYWCHYCNITSLQNIHRYTHKISGKFYCNTNPIKSHILGLLLIKDLKEVVCYETDKMYKPAQIINNYLKQPMSKQRMFDCQSELMQAGFKEYAQL